MTDAQRQEELYEMEDQYDSDLEKTLYHEYWADLRGDVVKKSGKVIRSKSVIKDDRKGPLTIGIP